MDYKVYVRGYGGSDQTMDAPTDNLPIRLINIGEVDSTMGKQIADEIIFHYHDESYIRQYISTKDIISWTREESDEWYHNNILNYSSTNMLETPYNNITTNLALVGNKEMGECGICYHNSEDPNLHWICMLQNRETRYLSEILTMINELLQPGDTAKLYWTACISKEAFRNGKKQVVFNPNPKMMDE